VFLSLSLSLSLYPQPVWAAGAGRRAVSFIIVSPRRARRDHPRPRPIAARVEQLQRPAPVHGARAYAIRANVIHVRSFISTWPARLDSRSNKSIRVGVGRCSACPGATRRPTPSRTPRPPHAPFAREGGLRRGGTNECVISLPIIAREPCWHSRGQASVRLSLRPGKSRREVHAFGKLAARCHGWLLLEAHGCCARRFGHHTLYVACPAGVQVKRRVYGTPSHGATRRGARVLFRYRRILFSSRCGSTIGRPVRSATSSRD
jgi:hypothetical protein